jgi:streptogramin lyase
MKKEIILNRYRLHYFTMLICVIFLFSGCGGSDDGGSILMSAAGQSGADIAGTSAPADGSFQAPAKPGKPQNDNFAKNSNKNNIFLSKTSDEITFIFSPAVYDLSQITVTAPNPAGKPIDRTFYPHTGWTIISGLGTLNGTAYSSPAPETVLFKAVYKHGGDIATADFVLKIVGLSSISLDINSDDLILAQGGATVYDLAGIAVTAHYSDGASKTVTNDAGTFCSINSGAGTLNGKIYAAPALPETAVFTIGHTQGSITKTAIFTLTTIANTPPAPSTAVNYTYAAAWTGITYTSGVAVDMSGNVYASGADHTIKKFGPGGGLITKWGSYGQGAGQFYNPAGIARSASGYIYVADQYNNRVQKFDSNGNYILHWGTPGPGNGQFSYQFGISTDRSGNVFVADTYNCRIQKFDSDGNFIFKFGSYGNGPGQFLNPIGVCADSTGNIYVSDFGNHRIQKFDSKGNYLSGWGGPGGGEAQFNGPSGMAFDENDYIYIADHYNNRIQKFDSKGNYITQFGNDGQLRRPHGIALDHTGGVYTADFYNHRVVKFLPQP